MEELRRLLPKQPCADEDKLCLKSVLPDLRQKFLPSDKVGHVLLAQPMHWLSKMYQS